MTFLGGKAGFARGFAAFGPLVLTLILSCTPGERRAGDPSAPIRAAHFPNFTHGPVLAARVRQTFEKALAPVPVEWHVFTAGPSVVEALFAGEIDLAYIGPGPAVTGYIRSEGQAVRVIAGLTQGGAALVAREGSGFKNPEDLSGRRIATPQIGNTQDLALRHWITEKGHKTSEQGGDVEVLPMPPADQLTLFQRGELDGAWAVEPWVSRLIQEGRGRLLLEESALWEGGVYATTILVAHPTLLAGRPDIVRRWLGAHEDILAWTASEPDSARIQAGEELLALTRYEMPDELVRSAWSRLTFSSDPAAASILRGAEFAQEVGFLSLRGRDMNRLIDLTLLNGVRRGRGLTEIR